MELNQTANEIAAEYEALAIKAANEHWHLKQIHPFSDFPALAHHVSFCSSMQRLWEDVAYRLDVGPEMRESDGENNASEWGLM